MSLKVTFFLIFFVSCVVLAKQNLNVKIPSFIKICHRSDQNLDKCISDSINLLRPMLHIGIPEFGIPSMEPLRIPEVVLDQGSGPISVRSTYGDIQVYGPSQFVIDSIKIDLNKNRIKMKLKIPSLYLQSNYRMNGHILLLPIVGNGKCKGNYSNIDAQVLIQGEIVDKDGVEYFNIKDLIINFNIGHAQIHLEDLFRGDENLGKAMNVFLNDNWKPIADELRPLLEDKVAELFKKLGNKICHRYPFNKLLPP